MSSLEDHTRPIRISDMNEQWTASSFLSLRKTKQINQRGHAKVQIRIKIVIALSAVAHDASAASFQGCRCGVCPVLLLYSQKMHRSLGQLLSWLPQYSCAERGSHHDKGRNHSCELTIRSDVPPAATKPILGNTKPALVCVCLGHPPCLANLSPNH